MTHRAVITGLGMMTPLGNHPATFFSAALLGKPGIGSIKKFDARAYPVRIGAEITAHPATSEALKPKEMSIAAWWAVSAARQAVADAGLVLESLDPYSVDVVLGVSISSLEGLDDLLWEARPHPPDVIPPEALVVANPISAVAHICRELGIKGEAVNITTACSSSTNAIGYATRLIQHGQAECVITGGADEGLTRLFLGAYGPFCLSKRNDNPAQSSRPFEKERDGFVLGDAACVLVLEEYSRAAARGAPIYGEITGFGCTNDASSSLGIARSEEAGVRALQRALREARIEPEDIDYYSAFGISHPWLDIRETRMLKQVFRETARQLPISSFKAMTGHPMGASGALQVAACALSIQARAVHPTINYHSPDPECDLDYIPNEARSLHIRHAATYTLGNGGTNAALVVSAC